MLPPYRETERPRCPFCGEPFGRPPEADLKREGDFPKWLCVCGAVGAYDATGHNLGEALMEAIAFAYGEDWEMALTMEAETDYEVKYLDCYHRGDHRLLAGRRTYGTGLAAFVFVKVKTLRHLH